MKTIIHEESKDTNSRLFSLGLDQELLTTAVLQGVLARSNVTENHPPMYGPFVLWAETVSALRELLASKRWTRSDDNNYSRVISSTGTVAVAVATGNEGTGLAAVTPLTKAPKGPITSEAISTNCAQLDFFIDETSSQQKANKLTTWILLIHPAHDEIRCELSLPSSMADDGRIDGWSERILLPPIQREPESEEVSPPQQPDLDIQVKRRS